MPSRHNKLTRSALFIGVAVISLFTAAFAEAQSKSQSVAPKWQKMPLLSPEAKAAGIFPGGEGGQWPRGGVSVGPSDPDFLLFPIDVGGLYRSLDGGKNWEMALVGWNARGANGFAMDPKNPDRVLGIAGNSLNWKPEWGQTPHGVYLSTNKASSWKQVLGSPDGFGCAVAYEPASFDAAKRYCTTAYYASHTQGLFRSDDGGVTWRKISEQPIGMNPDEHAPVLLKCHPTRRGTVYLGGKNGLFKSEDGGKSFVNIRGGEVWGLAVVPSQPDCVYVSGSEGILRSTDAGKTFTPLAAAGLDRLNNKPVRDIAVSPADPQRIACWVPGDNWKWPRYVSHDGGSTFQTVTTVSKYAPLPQNARQGYVNWHPSDPKIAWNLGGDWVTKSTDGGRTYQWSANGYNGVMLGGLFNFSVHAPNTVFLAFQDYNGAFTADGGTTWNYGDVSGKGWGGYCYGGYAVDADVMWCGDAPDWGGKRTLRISRDSGNTWAAALGTDGKPLQFAGPDVSFSDPTDRRVLFASNLRSEDKGVTWRAMTDCDGVYTYHPGTRALYGKKGDTLVQSVDKGATWTRITDCKGGVGDLALDHRSGRIYVASEERLKVFENGTWSTIETPRDQYGSTRVTTVAVDPQSPAVVYVGGPRNLYTSHATVCRSTDGGRTWRNLTNTAPLEKGIVDSPHEVAAIRVHPATREAWVNGQCFGMWRIAPPAPGETGLPAAEASAPRAVAPPSMAAVAALSLPLAIGVPQPAKTESPLIGSPGYWPDYPKAWNDVHNGFVERARRDSAKIRVVFLGDSITQGWDKTLWQKHFEPAGAVNFGIGGDGVQQLQWRVENGELDPLKPRLIVLMIGINNFWGKKGTNEEIVQGTAKLVRTLREKQPQSKILLLGILPAMEGPADGARTRIKAINLGYSKLADGKAIRFLDIGSAFLEPDGRISKEVMRDYLHPTSLGYERFLKAMLPTFEEMRK